MFTQAESETSRIVADHNEWVAARNQTFEKEKAAFDVQQRALDDLHSQICKLESGLAQHPATDAPVGEFDAFNQRVNERNALVVRDTMSGGKTRARTGFGSN